MIDQKDPLPKSQRKITYSKESAIQSLIRGPNTVHSLIKGSLYYCGLLKAWPILISAHKSYFIAFTSIQQQSKLMWKEKIGK